MGGNYGVFITSLLLCPSAFGTILKMSIDGLVTEYFLPV